MPNSIKSIMLLILLLLGVSPLYGNLPCEDGGCYKKCKCEHTHGHPDPQDLYEEFSGYPENGQKKRSGDIPWAEANQMPFYLVTPKDKLKEYVPNGKHSEKEINYGSI